MSSDKSGCLGWMAKFKIAKRDCCSSQTQPYEPIAIPIGERVSAISIHRSGNLALLPNGTLGNDRTRGQRNNISARIVDEGKAAAVFDSPKDR